jgi:hypothetical protein
VHIFRWDLDKTYLETDFHSVRSLLKHAVEPAAHKLNVPGSAALLRALSAHDADSSVWIVSGSPIQMRPRLEEKLALDGIHPESLVLKDNLRNLRQGRLRDVRGQVGYKLTTLLRQRARQPGAPTETLFGDDAEVDALIYTLYAEAIAGTVDAALLATIMREGNAYEDSIEDAVANLEQLEHSESVEDIFIRIERGTTALRHYKLLGRRVIPVWSWLQAAFVLHGRGRIDAEGVGMVATACAHQAGLAPEAVASLVQDIVRRNHVALGAARLLCTSALGPLSSPALRALDRLAVGPDESIESAAPDYLAFLRATR